MPFLKTRFSSESFCKFAHCSPCSVLWRNLFFGIIHCISCIYDNVSLLLLNPMAAASIATCVKIIFVIYPTLYPYFLPPAPSFLFFFLYSFKNTTFWVFTFLSSLKILGSEDILHFTHLHSFNKIININKINYSLINFLIFVSWSMQISFSSNT